ncbi:hypothetical protein AEA09_08540 [Lysinibacillus contaminans]|uniref:Uncharacterized protein n=1 Tax=Lysinibacillus contaminans TaxID=1293441 RepID=A0ABR5K1J8_9BACI|nr:hypothetical protein [Lysinibacillus contaminans]KOS68592.1 hypothetical protein AEA09_08540 [Lysinibacillus contaminans]
MDQIRNAINNIYKEGKFSDEKQAKTFQRVQPKKRLFFTPLLLTVFVTGCLLIGLNMLLSQHNFESNFQYSSTTSIEIFPEYSGKVKDYRVLKQPWMVAGMVGIIISFFFALFALKKKWLWRVLLSVIIIIAILGNMSERIGYRYYVKDDADILNTLQSGVFAIGNAEDAQLYDTITINQYRFSYFSTNVIRGIVFFKHDGRGYALDFGFLGTEDLMSSIHVPDIRHIFIPLLEGHSIEKLMIQINTKRTEVVVDSNRAQLVAVPYETEVSSSEITIQAYDHEGNVLDLYKPSDIFTYPVN